MPYNTPCRVFPNMPCLSVSNVKSITKSVYKKMNCSHRCAFLLSISSFQLKINQINIISFTVNKNKIQNKP